MPAKLLIKHISDTDNICSWNKTLKRSEVLRRISDTVGISYQVSLYFDAYPELRKCHSKLEAVVLNCIATCNAVFYCHSYQIYSWHEHSLC